jgi:hypothetical protein
LERPRLLLDAEKRTEAPDEHYSSGRMAATIDAGDEEKERDSGPIV